MIYAEIVRRIYIKQRQTVTLTFSPSDIRPDYWILVKKKKNPRRKHKTVLNSLKDMANRLP